MVVLVANAPYRQCASCPSLACSPQGSRDAAGDDPNIFGPGRPLVPAMTVAQDPGQLHHAGFGVGVPVRVQRGGPVLLTDLGPTWKQDLMAGSSSPTTKCRLS